MGQLQPGIISNCLRVCAHSTHRVARLCQGLGKVDVPRGIGLTGDGLLIGVDSLGGPTGRHHGVAQHRVVGSCSDLALQGGSVLKTSLCRIRGAGE